MEKTYARVIKSYKQSSLLIESVLAIVRPRYNKNTFNSRSWNIQRYRRWVIDLSVSHWQTLIIISLNVVRLQWCWWQNNIDNPVKNVGGRIIILFAVSISRTSCQRIKSVRYAGVFWIKKFRKNTAKNWFCQRLTHFQVLSTQQIYLSLANHCLFSKA